MPKPPKKPEQCEPIAETDIGRLSTEPGRLVMPHHAAPGGIAPAIPPRGAGILLHISSLSGPEGIGTLGSSAHAILNWLEQAGLNYWQVLPVCEGGNDNSPYASRTSLVGSPWLIDLTALYDQGLLTEMQLENALDNSDGPIDFDAVRQRKWPALRAAATSLIDQTQHAMHTQWQQWREQNKWMAETALFQALRVDQKEQPWWKWTPGLRDRNPESIKAARKRLSTETTIWEVLAFLFDHQWHQLQQAAGERNIWLFGDLPIYVAHNSADVWANRSIFELDANGKTTRMAGVPPDSFSDTGQLWRNPLYDWSAMSKNKYAWWVHRLRRTLQWTPVLRIDHFRGFAAYWAVPSDADNATEGEWLTGPGLPIFERFRDILGGQWLVAEDLGEIDDTVHQLRRTAGLLCTRVMQFAFETDDTNIHLPQNCPTDATLYTGTHDNDTTRGWWRTQSPAHRAWVLNQLNCDEREVVPSMIQAALGSSAQIVIIPVQDLLELDSEARMNVPGTEGNNWTWRMEPRALDTETAHTMRGWTNGRNRKN